MNFNFTREEELWQWAVKDFTDRELAPKQIHIFDAGFRSIVRKMGALGFLGVNLSEEYGGDPANAVMFGLLLEEVARVHAGAAYFILTAHEVCAALDVFGADDIKQRWLPGLIRGDTIGSLAISEPPADRDVSAMAARAERQADDYRITGCKQPVAFGLAADIALALVQTSPAGPALFAVALDLAGIGKSDAPGMGLSLAAPAVLAFDGVRIPGGCRIGAEGEGNRINAAVGLRSPLHQIATGLIALAMAQTAIKLAVRYGRERHAFGKPIASFQGISHKIAEDATLLEAGRWLCYRALSLKDSGKGYAREAAMCGWWCPKISHQAIQNSLLVHGHAGYCDDHPFERMLRDVVGLEMISGTEQILKLVVGSQVIGPGAVPDCLLELVD